MLRQLLSPHLPQVVRGRTECRQYLVFAFSFIFEVHTCLLHYYTFNWKQLLTGLRANINSDCTIYRVLIVFLAIESKLQNTMEKHCDSENSNEDSLSYEMKSYQMSWEHCLETLKTDNIRREMTNTSYISLGVFLLTILTRKH
jgi:hypothetical protein